MTDFLTRLDLLNHDLRNEAREIARLAAHVIRGLDDEEELTSLIEAISEESPPEELSVLTRVAVATAELQPKGAESAQAIKSAAEQVAQAWVADDEERGAFLFVLPVQCDGSAPMHLSKAFSVRQHHDLSTLLLESGMVDGESVVLFPRLMSIHELVNLDVGAVNALKHRLLSGTSAAGFKSFFATLEPPEDKRLLAIQSYFKPAENRLKTFPMALVGVVFCEDRFDPPFPLERAYALAHDDLDLLDDADFDAHHTKLHKDRMRLLAQVAGSLQSILKSPDLAFWVAADAWFEIVPEVYQLHRKRLLVKELELLANSLGVDFAQLRIQEMNMRNRIVELELQGPGGAGKRLRFHCLPDEKLPTPLIELVSVLRELGVQMPKLDQPDAPEAGGCEPSTKMH